MARINTRDKLKEYLKIRLGAPTLRVELTESQLDLCIDKAIEVYSYYAYDGTEEVSLLVNLEKGKFDYKLPDRTVAVSGLESSSLYSTFVTIPTGYTLAINPLALNMQNDVSNIDIQSMTQLMSKMSDLRSMFDVKINFDFNSNTKILRFLEQPSSTVAVLELALDYEPLDVDDIYNNQLIKKLAEGEAWLAWGTVHGKFTNATLVNGSEVNYSEFISRGNDLVEKATEEMMELREPLGIYVC